MKTEIGEYVVGAYLKLCLRCDFVDYNVRPPVAGLEGLGELDVVGLEFHAKRAYLCEVTTHLRGTLYKSNQETVARIKKKYQRQKEYADRHLKTFKDTRFMFWSPCVPRGYITERLEKIDGLELVINGDYKKCVEELRLHARKSVKDEGNPFFRAIQILEHLRD